MTTIRCFIKTHSLLIYFTLAFVISWGVILISVGLDGIPVTTDQIMVLVIAMLLGPSVAGILLTGLTSGKEGFSELVSRLLNWRVSVRWYVVALLTAPLSTVAVLLLWNLYTPNGLNKGLIRGLDIFFIIHVVLHLLFLRHPKNEFNSTFSWIIILGAGVAGLVDLLANF